MIKSTTAQTPTIPETVMPSEWQQAYLAGASAIGTSWLDFMGERFHAYAHAIDDISHCHDLNEAWQVQSTFGRETAKVYSEQVAKLSGMMLKATNGDAGETAE